MKSIYTIIFLFLLTIPNFALSFAKLSNNMTNIEPRAYILAGAGISRVSEKHLFSKKKNNSQKIKFSPAPVFNGQFGYRINRFCRADFNVQYRKIKIKTPESIKSLKISNYIASVNGYLDLNNASRLTPYITAGVGLSSLHLKKNKSNTSVTSSDSNGISFNIGAGVQLQLSDDFGIDLGYRYTSLGKLKIKYQSEQPGESITKSPTIGAHELLINFLIIL